MRLCFQFYLRPFWVRVIPDTLGKSCPHYCLYAGREDVGGVVIPHLLPQALIGAKLDVIEKCFQ